METGDPTPERAADDLPAGAEPTGDPWIPLLEAASKALAPEAARLWDRALQLMALDHPDRPLVHAHRALTAWACGDNATATEHAHQAIATTDRPEVTTRARATLALIALAETGATEPEPVDLDLLLTAHATGTTTRDEDVAMAIALADQAIAEVVGGHTRQGTRTAAAVLRLAGTDSTSNRAAIPARMALTLGAIYDGRISDARAIAHQFMDQVDADPDSLWTVAYAPWAVDGLAWVAAGEHREALSTIALGRERARTAKTPVVESIFDPIESLAHLSAGHWDDAIAVADDHLARTSELPSRTYHPWLLGVKAIITARRDDPTTARTHLERAREQPTTLHGGGHLVRWAEATIARAEDRHDDARTILREIDEDFTTSGSQVGWIPISLDLIHQEFEVGAKARARCRALISRLAPGQGASPTSEALWHGVHCFAAGDLGGLTDAANALAAPFPFESARLYVGAVVVAHWYGRNASAVRLARRAHVAFGRLGATLEQRRLAELLQERGLELPPTEETPIGLEGLTEDETRIAALVCDGHSNAEVAAAVGIAIPKVEAMLHDIYAKAGVNDRLRLAALVAAHAPPWARSRDT